MDLIPALVSRVLLGPHDSASAMNDVMALVAQPHAMKSMGGILVQAI